MNDGSITTQQRCEEAIKFIASCVDESRINIYNYSSPRTIESIYKSYIISCSQPVAEQTFKTLYRSYIESLFSSSTPPKPDWLHILEMWKDYERLEPSERLNVEPSPIHFFIQNLVSSHILNSSNKYTEDLISSLRHLFISIHNVPNKYKYYIEDLIAVALKSYHISFCNPQSELSWP